MNEKKKKIEVEHTLDFGTIMKLGCYAEKQACYEIISWKYIVIDSINHVVELA
ncbi:MAG: hypothetical protein ACLTMH_14740 [Faecalimonas umbilicata]|uniref:hypothetical protein n=1 Tax=Faecalimonas umbilicata TaxID=1912855 RepID=UPI00399482FD